MLPRSSVRYHTTEREFFVEDDDVSRTPFKGIQHRTQFRVGLVRYKMAKSGVILRLKSYIRKNVKELNDNRKDSNLNGWYVAGKLHKKLVTVAPDCNVEMLMMTAIGCIHKHLSNFDKIVCCQFLMEIQSCDRNTN